MSYCLKYHVNYGLSVSRLYSYDSSIFKGELAIGLCIFALVIRITGIVAISIIAVCKNLTHAIDIYGIFMEFLLPCLQLHDRINSVRKIGYFEAAFLGEIRHGAGMRKIAKPFEAA